LQEQRKKKAMGRRIKVKSAPPFIKGKVIKDLVWWICAINIGCRSGSPRVR
jgi:hypothetical protein